MRGSGTWPNSVRYDLANLFVYLHELGHSACAAHLKMVVRELGKQESVTRQQGTFTEQTTHGKGVLDKHMLQIRSVRHQVCNPREIAGRVLGSRQIRDSIGNVPVFPASHNSLGAGKVVMEKLAVGKSAADASKEVHHFVVRERSPAWKGDLEVPNAHTVCPANALKNLPHRQRDDAHHGVQTGLLHFLPKNLDYLLELAVGQGVSFACRSHQINVLKPVTNDVADMLTKLSSSRVKSSLHGSNAAPSRICGNRVGMAPWVEWVDDDCDSGSKLTARR